MELSVVVPTLNARERLRACLDALAEHVPDADVVVVNGPSTDGTTGMVQSRDDVDLLLELSERNLNVARNAGIAGAIGDVVALIEQGVRIDERWVDAVASAIRQGSDVVSGPVDSGTETPDAESTTVAGRTVTYFDGGNVAFTRDAIESADGFDEYLQTGSARDCAHRLAGAGRTVTWSADARGVRDADSSTAVADRDWGWKYRSLAYRLVKNYGPRPTVFRRTFQDATADGLGVARSVLTGDTPPSSWLGSGRNVVGNVAIGTRDGLVARVKDRSPARNPNGLSSRADRVVERYDWR